MSAPSDDPIPPSLRRLTDRFLQRRLSRRERSELDRMLRRSEAAREFFAEMLAQRTLSSMEEGEPEREEGAKVSGRAGRAA